MTNVPAITAAKDAQSRLPAFVRPADAVRLTSVGMTRLREAIAAGEVRSHSVTRPGRKRGVRLIEVASLVAWARGEKAPPSL